MSGQNDRRLWDCHLRGDGDQEIGKIFKSLAAEQLISGQKKTAEGKNSHQADLIQNKPQSLHAKVPPAALCVISLTFVIPAVKVSKEKNVGFLAIFAIGIKIA